VVTRRNRAIIITDVTASLHHRLRVPEVADVSIADADAVDPRVLKELKVTKVKRAIKVLKGKMGIKERRAKELRETRVHKVPKEFPVVIREIREIRAKRVKSPARLPNPLISRIPASAPRKSCRPIATCCSSAASRKRPASSMAWA
jgi:hypothetical protein